jgi:predicted DNA repair protein MutK
MSTGLIALLDDIVSLAQVAAASLDDVAAQAAKAGAKAAGVVIDDAAVTPRYVVGFDASRELPIIRRIAVGSLRNKLFYLLPAALGLSLLAPWAITPLLMLGGAYLCFEGAEKVLEAVLPHAAHGEAAAGHDAAAGAAAGHGADGTAVAALGAAGTAAGHGAAAGAAQGVAQGVAQGEAAGETAESFEDSRVRGAIKTDFILSAEIMAIALASVPEAGFVQQALVLALVGVGITVAVYGAVALIVKADDAGVALARTAAPVSRLLGRGAVAPSRADRLLRPLSQALGRGLVRGMPTFLRLLGLVGTAAMVWVGGGIIIHGLEKYGLTGIGHAVAAAAAGAAGLLPGLAGVLGWLAGAAAAGGFGLLLGAALVLVVERVARPLAVRLRGRAGSGG